MKTLVDLLTSPISLYLRLLYDHGVCAYFFSLSSLYFHLLIYITRASSTVGNKSAKNVEQWRKNNPSPSFSRELSISHRHYHVNCTHYLQVCLHVWRALLLCPEFACLFLCRWIRHMPSFSSILLICGIILNYFEWQIILCSC